MKKILFILLLLFTSFPVNAQFKATKDGIVTENGEKFYVVNIEGKSAVDLYKSANSWVIANFKNPNVVANKQENEMINVHGVFPAAFICKKVMGVEISAKVDMNIVMYFKDGRVRFDIPVIQSMYFNDKDQVMFSGGVNIMGEGDINMFKNNGKPNKEKVIKAFNEFINGEINSIIEYMKGQKNEDW